MRVFKGPTGLLYVVEESGKVTNIDPMDNTVLPGILTLEDIEGHPAFPELRWVTL